MKIKTMAIEMAYDEWNAQVAAERTEKETGCEISFTGEFGGGCWPLVTLTGTPAKVAAAFQGGPWTLGDADEDAEMLFYMFQGATVVEK